MDIYLLSPSKKNGTISLPMISFKILTDKIDFSRCDTLIFTSKQAVISADTIDKRWKEYPSVAVGGATRDKIEEMGGRVLFHPKKFYGKSLAEDIKKYFWNIRLLYLRPKEISFDTKGYLQGEGIELEEQIIYKTDCVTYNEIERPPENSIIIFTSPSTIKCFFKNFRWRDSYHAILIGKTTKKHLPKGCRYSVADKPLIDYCIKKAKEVAKDSNF